LQFLLKMSCYASERLEFQQSRKIINDSEMENYFDCNVKWQLHLVKLIVSNRVVMMSVSPTFNVQLFCMKVFCTAFLHLQFGFVIFWKKHVLAQNLLVKCWWNWIKVSISPKFYKQLFSPVGVNFINIFTYERHFSSFYYVHVTIKTCRNDICTKNSYVKRWWNWH